MNNSELLKIMNQDCNFLKEHEIQNVCLVKRKIDSELVPTHILFNYWFKSVPVTLKAIRNSDGTYKIGFKDDFFIKKVSLNSLIKTLNSFKVEVQLGHNGMVLEAKFYKRNSKKGKL